jgi:thymidine phosphorylase
VASCDGEDLGRVAAEVGAGRRRVDEELAHGAGILVHARIGDQVEKGQPLATLLIGDREVDEKRLVEKIRNAFVIGEGQVEPPALILGTVDDITK